MSEIALDGDSLSDELLLFCQSDSISMEGLRQILQRHGMTSANDSRHVIDYSFFFYACHNEHVDEAIIKCLIEYFPDAASVISDRGETPLHYACLNKIVKPNIIRLLIDSHPTSLQVANHEGEMPLHYLCRGQSNNDSEGTEILKILLKDCSSTTKHANNAGMLPIHYASVSKSSEFCGMLIDAYPGSERIRDNEHGSMPFHIAICENDIATVKYLYKLYPEAANCPLTIHNDQILPILMAMTRLIDHDDHDVRRGTVDIVRFLLKCDPNIKFQKFGQMDLLNFACRRGYDYSYIDEGIKVVEAIYDAHPELINDDVLDYDGYHPRIQTFLDGEFVYASQAKDQRIMTTPDEKGRLPLHQALENNVRLGSIKLLVEGNPSALRNMDMNYSIPLHIACEHHDSSEVIEYLIGLDPSLLRYEDIDGNTALHYACRGAKYTTIALLLDKFDAISVSRKNRHSKLPIDLFMESDAVEDRESVEYIDIIFRLLRAYPGALGEKALEVRQSVSASSSSTDHVGKKRKVGD